MYFLFSNSLRVVTFYFLFGFLLLKKKLVEAFLVTEITPYPTMSLS